MSSAVKHVAKAILEAVSVDAKEMLAAQGLSAESLPEGAVWCPITQEQAEAAARAAIEAMTVPSAGILGALRDFTKAMKDPD